MIKFSEIENQSPLPLAEYGSTRNLNIHLRCKHVFWQGPAHKELWSRLSSPTEIQCVYQIKSLFERTSSWCSKTVYKSRLFRFVCQRF